MGWLSWPGWGPCGFVLPAGLGGCAGWLGLPGWGSYSFVLPAYFWAVHGSVGALGAAVGLAGAVSGVAVCACLASEARDPPGAWGLCSGRGAVESEAPQGGRGGGGRAVWRRRGLEGGQRKSLDGSPGPKSGQRKSLDGEVQV